MEGLVDDILAKKELASLDKVLVLEELEKFFEKNPKLKKRLEVKGYNRRSEEYRVVVKEIRKTLRDIYGVFIKKNYSKRYKLLSGMNQRNRAETIKSLLELHQSTKERLPYYEDIYRKLLGITGPQEKILDLACGLNPLSYSWLGYNPKYTASDISEKDLEFIEMFFKKENINGSVKKIDLVSETSKLKGLKSNICFLLKTLDTVEIRKKRLSKELIAKIEAKWIVLSFAKKSIGGHKTIKTERRSWIKKILTEMHFEYREFEVPNEYFIVVKK